MTVPGKGFISQLPIASVLSPTDAVVLDQQTASGPITRQAPLSLVYPPPTAFAINKQTGANYNPVLADSVQTIIEMNNASTNTVTIQPHASVAAILGSVLILRQMGAGASGFAAAGGVTLLNASTNQCRTQYSLIAAVQETLDTWIVCGDML